MKKRHFLSKFILAIVATMALAACGDGDSGDDDKRLPTGKVGTKGDGVNQVEFDAVQCGMTRDQVAAIVADEPTSVESDSVRPNGTIIYDVHGLRTYFVFNVNSDLIWAKAYGVLLSPPTQSQLC